MGASLVYLQNSDPNKGKDVTHYNTLNKDQFIVQRCKIILQKCHKSLKFIKCGSQRGNLHQFFIFKIQRSFLVLSFDERAFM